MISFGLVGGVGTSTRVGSLAASSTLAPCAPCPGSKAERFSSLSLLVVVEVEGTDRQAAKVRGFQTHHTGKDPFFLLKIEREGGRVPQQLVF